MGLNWDWTIRLLVAGLLGGAIGLERTLRAKEAGIRTHFLVAMGSALFMIVSQHGFPAPGFDASRVAAQVVSGIGFIGAGIIIFQKNAVHGLTTAAGLWVTAAIGLACGGGLHVIAAVAAALTVISLEAMGLVMGRLAEKTFTIIVPSGDSADLSRVLDRLKGLGAGVEGLSSDMTTARITLKVRSGAYLKTLQEILSSIEGVMIEP